MHKEAYIPYQGVLSKPKEKKRQSHMDIFSVIQDLLLIIFCFLIGRAVLFNELAPFGIALLAVILHRRVGGFSSFLAISAGLLSWRLGLFSLKYIAAMVVVGASSSILQTKKDGILNSRIGRAVSVFVALFTVNMIFIAVNNFLIYDIILGLFESVLAFIMFYVFSRAADVFIDHKRRRILSSEEIICISIFLALAIIGFWNIQVWSLSLRGVFSIFLILLSAYIGGAGVGASIGITVGFVLSLASSPDPVFIANLAVCGLMAGTFKELGRVGSSLAFLLANILMTFYINQSTFVILPFGEIVAAGAILLVFPKKGLLVLKQFLDYTFMRTREQQYYVKRMQELTVGRLNEFSQVFHHLSKAFGRISERNTAVGQEELSKLFDLVAEEVCKGCALYRSCWQRDFYNTYSNMFDMLTACETKGMITKDDIPVSLKRRCLDANRLVDALNNVYSAYRTNLNWQERIEDCRHLVAEQLEGVSHVVTQLASELDMDIRFKKDIEDAIHFELDRNGIRVKEILVLEKAGGKLEVSISKYPCQGKRECHRQVDKIVSAIMGKPMGSNHKVCTNGGKDTCVIRLTEAQQFEVLIGVSRKTKQYSKSCGDSYSFSAIKDGKYMLALSDGMGSGSRAAEESSAVISLLENFLEAGFDQDITIRTINSILMLRSRDEIFATADLCVLDLVSANADFIKIGGVSAFIRKDDYVEVIKDSSLPIGILEDVQLKTISTTIDDADMIIMVTDGILDAFDLGEEGERCMADMIALKDTKNPQELADYIMEEALAYTSGEAKDDMTVMVTKVWKPLRNGKK